MKNIRRRVYDALNVLMAMNIIEKEKKEIRWVGLPTSSIQECRRLEEEKSKRQERIKQKAEQLQELIIQVRSVPILRYPFARQCVTLCHRYRLVLASREVVYK